MACLVAGGVLSAVAAVPVSASSSWSTENLPAASGGPRPNQGVGLGAVSCLSSTSCVAVGVYDGGRDLLAETLSGTTWTTFVGSLPAGATAISTNGISCRSVAACVAVGSYQATNVPIP